MVKVLNFSYIFKYPFELVTQAYFKKVSRFIKRIDIVTFDLQFLKSSSMKFTRL